MGRLSASDLRHALGFLGSVDDGLPDEPLPKTTLVALRDLLGADEAEYFEFRRADRGVLAWTVSDEVTIVPGTDVAMQAFGYQNPLGWRRRTAADGAMRLSERLRRRDLERLEFYQGFMRPNRLRDMLKVWLLASDESVACVQLWRHADEFTRRQQDLLGALHLQLIAMRERALRARASDPEDGASFTPREAEIITWLARGASDAEIAQRLVISPGTVGKHLDNVYAKLGAHSRADAIGRILYGRGLGPT